MSKPFFVKLKDRAFVYLEGEDRYDFLQGLVSQDVHKLKSQPALYACLLTPQGKFLHDFFLIEGLGYILIECEGRARAADLYDRLTKFRLRSNIKMNVEEFVPVYAVFGEKEGYPDPRHPDMGYRCFEKPDCDEKPFEVWDCKRLELGIPDGSRDMEIEKSTLLECNIDKFKGVDWDKGCYMGQELTARMHYRGLAKRHLYPVRIEGPVPAPGTDIHFNGVLAGIMRSSCGDLGLALLKDDMISVLQSGPIKPLSVA